MQFRQFENEEEEWKADSLIATIDKGERWIFTGAEGSGEFGGFIDRLFFSDQDAFGTYCSCIFRGKLRIQLGFQPDLPDALRGELKSLILKARERIKSFTSIWYMPDNRMAEEFLFHELPWEARGHKTHELTAFPQDYMDAEVILPENIKIIPFEDKYLMGTCAMLDRSLAHTFDDPDRGVFVVNSGSFRDDWIGKARSGDCCIMLENDDVLGAVILNGAEIEFLAVDTAQQGRGLGRQLLLHAVKHIFTASQENPFLYCIDKNPNALRFYLREGMKVTGHSGYAYWQQCGE